MKVWIWFLLCWLAVVQCFAKGYQTFEEKGKIGMKDDSGNVVLPPAFEALGWSDENFSVIGEVTGYRLNGSWGIINLKKEFITKPDYESLVYAGGDCIVARKKINRVMTKSGCINLKGEVRIPFVYDGINVLGLRAIVFNLIGSRYYYGLTDLSNQILISVVYKNIRPLGTLRFAVENTENKIALFGEDGKPVTDFLIDSVSVFYKGFAIVYQDHLQGMIDRDGMVKLEIKYNRIAIDEDGKVSAQLPNEWFFINGKNETIKKLTVDEVTPINERKYIVRKGKFWGVVNQEFKTIIPTRYGMLTQIAPEKYLVTQNGKMGVITETSKIIAPLLYDTLIKENEHYRAYKRNYGWQLLNANGKEISEKYYEKLLPANDLGFFAMSKGFFGVVSFEGREFVHCVFDSIAQPIDGLMAVKFKNKYGIINSDEDWLVAPQAYPLFIINKQRYLQKQPGNNFIKSYKGEILYFSPYPIKFNKENCIEFLPDGTEKTISYSGEIVERTSKLNEGEKVFSEHEGLRGIKKDDRYGFVDHQGRLRIANRYDSIGDFNEGVAGIKLIGKWGFVNTSDQIVINPNYDQCSVFQNGFAIVSRNKKFGVIAKDGTLVLPLRYDQVKRLPSNKFLLTSSSMQGLADEFGNVLVEPRFSSLAEQNEKWLIACQGGKCGAITISGLNVIPTIYDDLKFFSAENIFLAERKSEWKSIEIK